MLSPEGRALRNARGGWVILVMLRWEDSSWVAEDPGASMSREELSTSVYSLSYVVS